MVTELSKMKDTLLSIGVDKVEINTVFYILKGYRGVDPLVKLVRRLNLGMMSPFEKYGYLKNMEAKVIARGKGAAGVNGLGDAPIIDWTKHYQSYVNKHTQTGQSRLAV